MHRRRRYRLVQALTLPSSAAVAIAAGLLLLLARHAHL